MIFEDKAMDDFISTPLLTIFSIVVIAESLKTLFLGTVGAFKRGQKLIFINQEDANWLGGKTVSHDLADPSARICRAHRNNLENLIPFFILGFLYLLIGAHSYAGIAYFLLFFIGRIGHTYAYLNARPMLRRNMYSLAWLSMIAIAVHTLIVLLSRL